MTPSPFYEVLFFGHFFFYKNRGYEIGETPPPFMFFHNFFYWGWLTLDCWSCPFSPLSVYSITIIFTLLCSVSLFPPFFAGSASISPYLSIVSLFSPICAQELPHARQWIRVRVRVIQLDHNGMLSRSIHHRFSTSSLCHTCHQRNSTILDWSFMSLPVGTMPNKKQTERSKSK